KVISLIISDVVGDNLDIIASGPTVPDPTTYKESYKILEKYNLIEKVPVNVLNVINSGLKNESLENPKNNHMCFRNVHNYLIGTVSVAIQEIELFLEKQNILVDYFSNAIVGEAKDFGIDLYRIISEKIKSSGNKNLALIGTGELTVTLKGKGIGGRNQEMLLSFLDFIKNKKVSYKFLILAANLDGIEGNSKAMGAIADNFTRKRIIQEKIDTKTFLDNNDSNSFFKALNCELVTGYTGVNVNDIILILINLK
ncbi:MAG TPA: MOFRL family protein, partial [Candidatus Lokiarchaeia archaeon]